MKRRCRIFPLLMVFVLFTSACGARSDPTPSASASTAEDLMPPAATPAQEEPAYPAATPAAEDLPPVFPPEETGGSAGIDEEAFAETMRLIRTEGQVDLTDETGTQLPLQQEMRLFSGTSVQTQTESKAGISLDEVKAATVGERSLARLMQERKYLHLFLEVGEMYFSVAEPLAEAEEFSIETSSMTLGIRGTSGYVQAVSEEKCAVILTSGHAVIRSDQAEQEIVSGQCVYVTITEDGTPQFDVSEIAPQDYPALLMEELAEDERMLEEVSAQNEDVSTDQIKALNVYGEILADPAAYWMTSDWGHGSPTRFQYALATINRFAPVPTLLLSGEDTEAGPFVRFFQYDPETGSIHSPDEVRLKYDDAPEGLKGGLTVLNSGEGFLVSTWLGILWKLSLEGDVLNQENVWSIYVDGETIPDEFASEYPEWKELSEFGAQPEAAMGI